MRKSLNVTGMFTRTHYRIGVGIVQLQVYSSNGGAAIS